MDQPAENIESTTTGLQKGFKKIPVWLANKYLVSIIAFLVWMLFFAEKDLSSDFNKRAKYRELLQSEEHLIKKINETKIELGQLKTDAQTIEKYAREKYLMKKDNEDLFILTDEKQLK